MINVQVPGLGDDGRNVFASPAFGEHIKMCCKCDQGLLLRMVALIESEELCRMHLVAIALSVTTRIRPTTGGLH